MSIDGEPFSVPATTASDFDGILHLVALTEDVDDWVVTLTNEDGTVETVAPSPFSGGYYPQLAGRPSWFIDVPGDRWELTVGGRTPTLHGNRAGTVGEPPPAEPEGPSIQWAIAGLEQLARDWWDAPTRPRISSEALEHWDGLIEWWLHESDLPTPIRPGASGRRGSTRRIKGLTALFVDNSPAQWIYARLADERWQPETEELAQAVRHEMPVAFALNRNERASATFSRTLNQGPSTMKLGFSLHHVLPVSVRASRPERLSAEDLRESARRLLTPRNMFVLPKPLSGLGEIEAFIQIMSRGVAG